ncbi:MAG: hypothetical protein LBF22_00890 [Deltaproteobacteria bacterium]|jgi:tRNA (guanine-N7-)-methyltransferase|nr:hypothetical protein [Deltaproteobacteria bacterium]
MISTLPKKYYRSLAPLLSPNVLNQDLSWPRVFGREAPLELEIGFGNGEYLNRSSLERPENDFVGLEIAWPSLKRALRRLGNPKRTNVRLICLPAIPALTLYFPLESLTLARALFPVPWPREAQSKKRIFSRPFLDLLASRLKPQGIFHLVTDNLTLAEWIVSEAKDSFLKIVVHEKQAVLNTKYERKWQSLGQAKFYHLEGTKIGNPECPPLEPVVMHPQFLNNFSPLNFQPPTQTGEITILFRELIFDQNKKIALLKTKVVEGLLGGTEAPFIQEFFIRISQQPDGRWKLFPELSHLLFPTQGVQMALELAASEK